MADDKKNKAVSLDDFDWDELSSEGALVPVVQSVEAEEGDIFQRDSSASSYDSGRVQVIEAEEISGEMGDFGDSSSSDEGASVTVKIYSSGRRVIELGAGVDLGGEYGIGSLAGLLGGGSSSGSSSTRLLENSVAEDSVARERREALERRKDLERRIAGVVSSFEKDYTIEGDGPLGHDPSLQFSEEFKSDLDGLLLDLGYKHSGKGSSGTRIVQIYSRRKPGSYDIFRFHKTASDERVHFFDYASVGDRQIRDHLKRIRKPKKEIEEIMKDDTLKKKVALIITGNDFDKIECRKNGKEVIIKEIDYKKLAYRLGVGVLSSAAVVYGFQGYLSTLPNGGKYSEAPAYALAAMATYCVGSFIFGPKGGSFGSKGEKALSAVFPLRFLADPIYERFKTEEKPLDLGPSDSEKLKSALFLL